jgi:hypothetical protein
MGGRKKTVKRSPSSVQRDVVSELHKPARINFKRRRVIIKGINETLQADLVEMIPYAKENKQFKYILVVIDCFSKYVWTVPVKSKNAKDVTEAMKNVLLQLKYLPKNMQTDQGLEFYNSSFKTLMKKYKINHYSTFSSKKASIVERVNRTLKQLMWKEFSLQGNYKWLSKLDDITKQYNNTYHHTIKMKPSMVNKKNEENILKSVYTHVKIANKNNKYSVGDYVRISKHRSVFEKGYTPNWSNEIFIINKVRLTNPTTYLLKDKKGEDILGGFYEMELQKVKHPDVYLVEKVLKRKGNKLYVKWLGFNQNHNSWIDKSNIE